MATQPLVDDAGQPLPSFGFLNAHDAFRRDLPRFDRAAERLAAGTLDETAVANLRAHWTVYRTYLEEHHGFEDGVLFHPSPSSNPPARRSSRRWKPSTTSSTACSRT